MNEKVVRHPSRILLMLFHLPIHLYRLGLGWLIELLPIMVLTSRGRRSGQPRYTPLEYRRHGSKLYVISAFGEGADWYRNIQADPQVSLRIGRRRYSAHASRVGDVSEASRALYMFRRNAPVVYDHTLAHLVHDSDITLKTLPNVANRFTLVRFDLNREPLTLPVIPADHAWIWVLLAVTGIALSAASELRTRSKQSS